MDDALSMQHFESVCNLCGESCDGMVGPRQFKRLQEFGDDVGVPGLLAEGVECGQGFVVNAAENLRLLFKSGNRLGCVSNGDLDCGNRL